MSETVNDNLPSTSEFDPEAALLRLRRKEGNWVEWGQSCQQLQKAGHDGQQIFEATGFEQIHQNQLVVAAQVYSSMLEAGVQEATATHYSKVGSDSLYELRILTKQDRAKVADFLYERNINSEGSKDVAKAVKDYADLRQLPEGFVAHPGDAVAYQYWRYASQQNDLTDKARLVAKGLIFANSNGARQALEKLLGAIVAPSTPRPQMPLFRLESDEELPRFVPVAGKLPLAATVLSEIPVSQAIGAFSMVRTTWNQWVGLPGWQAVVGARDPVVLFAVNRDLVPDADQREELLILVDRASRDWDQYKYFALEREGQVAIEWSATAPPEPILGQVVLVLRPKRLLATGDSDDRWQIE
jgi:Rubisco Assembly chaperone C-terminal domain/Rubisco accumulation factor 1 alpha helical domain/Rubisco accumulation factor 1 helix turn helix domain